MAATGRAVPGRPGRQVLGPDYGVRSFEMTVIRGGEVCGSESAAWLPDNHQVAVAHPDSSDEVPGKLDRAPLTSSARLIEASIGKGDFHTRHA